MSVLTLLLMLRLLSCWCGIGHVFCSECKFSLNVSWKSCILRAGRGFGLAFFGGF